MTALNTGDREIAIRLSATAPDLLAALQRIATLDPAEWDLQYIARAALTQGGWGFVGNPARSQNSDDPSHPSHPSHPVQPERPTP